MNKNLIILLSGLILLGASCPGEDGEPVAISFDRKGLLQNVADAHILPTLQGFEQRAAELQAACEVWSAESASAEARAATQAAFHEAMDIWQEAELMQLGPAGVMGAVMGGRDLRDEIYSWPLVNPCAVDQQLVGNSFSSAGYFETKLVNVSGLDALEYVIFVEGEDNACPGPATINSEGQWAALAPADIVQRRAGYCVAAAKHLVAHAGELRDAWAPEGADFRGQLVEAGASSSVYASPAEALDALYAALFYIELKTKDRKLAVPAGLHVDCTAESCPELVESRYARRSKENIAANLRAFERLFTGTSATGEDGLGFDDFLVAANASELKERMLASLATARAAVESFDGSLEDALVSDVSRVREVHAAVRGLTDDLKSQLPSVLGLRVPREGDGDND